jgi:hypothetical protein
VALAKSQAGVEALKGQFSGPTQAMEGIRDQGAPAKDAPRAP